MSKIPYIVRRGDTLYFRIRVPAKLHSVIHKKEITQTLQTQDRTQAILVALRFAGEAKTIFNELGMDMAQKRREQASRDRLRVKEMTHKDELWNIELNHLSELRRVKELTALKTENELLKGAVNNSEPTSEQESRNLASTPMLYTALDEFERDLFW